MAKEPVEKLIKRVERQIALLSRDELQEWIREYAEELPVGSRKSALLRMAERRKETQDHSLQALEAELKLLRRD